MGKGNGRLLWLLLVVCWLAPGCCRLPAAAGANRAAAVEDFAGGSYDRAVVYLQQGRYELAREQFALVAATAESPLLRRLAGEGLAKAELVVVGRR